MSTSAPVVGKLPSHHVPWSLGYRAVNPAYPPLYLYAQYLSLADVNAAVALMAEYDPRVLAGGTVPRLGDIAAVLPADRAWGPGAEYTMVPFVYPSPTGSRFAYPDGPGAFYGADQVIVALAEAAFHHGTFLRMGHTAPGRYEFDVLAFDVDSTARVVDIGGLEWSLPAVYDTTDYRASQAFGNEARSLGLDGVLYDSVRYAGGVCLAAFRPTMMSSCSRVGRYLAEWDGTVLAGYSFATSSP